MRWRRATSIFSYWRAGQFVIENYRTGAVLSANPITTRVLHVFADWRSVEEAHQELPQYSYQSLARSIHHLGREGLLVREGSPQAKQDERFVASWSSWLPHAAILHFGTKDMPYTTSEVQTAKQMRSYLRQSPQPDFFKSSGATALSLPKVQLTDSEFSTVLLKRRTHREFLPGDLDAERSFGIAVLHLGSNWIHRCSPAWFFAAENQPFRRRTTPLRGIRFGPQSYECGAWTLSLRCKPACFGASFGRGTTRKSQPILRWTEVGGASGGIVFDHCHIPQVDVEVPFPTGL